MISIFLNDVIDELETLRDIVDDQLYDLDSMYRGPVNEETEDLIEQLLNRSDALTVAIETLAHF